MNEIKHVPKKDLPPQLLEIPEPPERLYLRGTLPKRDTLFLTVVGSRKYSSYGREACEKIIKDLAGIDVVIVSGLALGIDAIAHRAALSVGLTTIAFPGSGLSDVVLYPPSNYQLARQIVENGGALLSEFEPDFKATPYSFPQRNRLMAGIARGILVIEAEELSGTLITARLATEYNRDVFVVPGSIFSPQSRGTHMLLKLGAIPITGGSEILEHWGISEAGSIKQKANMFENCSTEEKQVIELLREPMTKEELITALGIPISDALVLLSMMEIKELIAETEGKIRMSI